MNAEKDSLKQIGDMFVALPYEECVALMEKRNEELWLELAHQAENDDSYDFEIIEENGAENKEESTFDAECLL